MLRQFTYLSCLLLSLGAFSQSTITGTVRDEAEEVIIGANVYIKGSYDGASSNLDGNYSFTTSKVGKQVLVISFIGYRQQEVEVDIEGDLSYDFVLVEAINKIDGITITAGAFDSGGERKRTILKPLDIVTTAGATADIASALNTLPGTQTVGESGRLFVRGGEGRETKTFIDGLEVMSFYGPAAPNTPTRSRFLPFMFSGTSFSTGGYSAEYGQALSSALILTTKEKPDQDRADISIMSVGGDVSYSKVWERSSLSGKLQYTNISPYFKIISQDLDWVEAPSAIEGSFMARQKVGKNGMYKLFVNLNSSNLVLNRGDIDDPSLITRTGVANDYIHINNSYKNILGKRWGVQGGISATRNNDNLSLNSDAIQTVQEGVHAKVVFTNDATEKLTLKFGSESFLRKAEEEIEGFGLPSRTNITWNEQVLGSFVEADYWFSNKLVVRAGGRLEYSSLPSSYNLAPRISLGYKTTDNSQLSLAYGRFQQTPGDQLLRINQNLGSEKAEHFIASYQVINNGRTFRIEGYAKQYEDLVKFDPGNQFDPAAYNNNGDGHARGFDVFWRDSQTFRNVDYWISYSFLDTERNYRDYPFAATPTFTSKHNFSWVYKHFITKIKSQIGFTYSFASPRPYNDLNGVGFNTGRTRNYQDLSFNISYLFKSNIIFYSSVSNVLGRDNIFGYEYGQVRNNDGQFNRRAITQPAPRFLFLGIFITLTKGNQASQLPYL